MSETQANYPFDKHIARDAAGAQYDPTRQTAVGDLKSDAKGSGARDNAGKARVDLLTWRDAAVLVGGAGVPRQCMEWLGQFQESHDFKALHRLVEALYANDMVLALRDAAAVFEFGAKKYKAWNWLKGMPWSVPVGCIGRHLMAMHNGEEIDPDSGKPHAGHVVCNVFMLLAYARTYTEGNDLPPKVETPIAFGGLARTFDVPHTLRSWKTFEENPKAAEATMHQAQGQVLAQGLFYRANCGKAVGCDFNLKPQGYCKLTAGHEGDCLP
jgi:hypothetical protein